MASYSSTVMTDAGLRLQAKVEMGTQLHFTRAVISDQRLPEGIEPEEATELTNERHIATSLSRRRVGSYQVNVEALFDNRELDALVDIYAIGLYALDPDDGEILFALSIATTDRVDYLPPSEINVAVIEYIHAFSIKLSRAVEVTIEESSLSNYVGREEFETHSHSAESGGEPIRGGDIDGKVKEAEVADYALSAGSVAAGSELDQLLTEHMADHHGHIPHVEAEGSGGEYTGTLSPALSAYYDGLKLTIVLLEDSGDDATLSLNGLAPMPIRGTISAGKPFILVFHGDGWELAGGSGGGGGDDFYLNGIFNPEPDVEGTFYRDPENEHPPTGVTIAKYSGYFEATRVIGTYYQDYAEYFAVTEDAEPGDIIRIIGPNRYGLTRQDADPLAMGVVSDSYHMCIGWQDGKPNIPIALAGKVRVKLGGPCKCGDFIVASDVAGVGRALASGEIPPPGAIVGRALEEKAGTTVERVLVLVKGGV